MLRRVMTWLAGDITPVQLDGWIYVLIAFFAAIFATFSDDTVYKYCNPTLAYWTEHLSGWAGAALLALKMYRSTAYADHLKKQATQDALDNGNSQITTTKETKETNEIQVTPTVTPVIPPSLGGH